MIKCDKGHCEMEGNASDLIIEMAIIINTFKECFEENADSAWEAAMAMSGKPTMDKFTISEA